MSLIIAVVFFAITIYAGIKKDQNNSRNRRYPEVLSDPTNQPKASVAGGPVAQRPRPYGTGRSLDGKTVVHPLDLKKSYDAVQTPKVNLPQNARPLINSELVPGIYLEPIQASVQTQGEAARDPQLVEKTLAESMAQREVDEAEEYWKNPVPVTSKTAGKENSKNQHREQLQKDLLPTTPQDLVQGIIMAEILQPPRCRRPYHPVFLERNK